MLDAAGAEITSSSHIGNKNPFRYRGYYYDTETKLYYLQTRYYDPAIGRFISRDSIEYADPETINGLNLYAYCGNNPVSDIILFMPNISTYGMGGSMNLGGHKGSISSSIIENGTLNRNSFNNIYNSIVLVNSNIFSFNGNFAKLIGNISVSTTTQLIKPSLFYTFTNYGTAGNSSGFGIHPNDWLDLNIYVSDNIGIGGSMQLTPWLVFGSNISIKDGVSISLGVVNGDTTNEISVSVGWGTIGGLAVAGGLAMSPIPGGRILGGLVALFSLIFI